MCMTHNVDNTEKENDADTCIVDSMPKFLIRNNDMNADFEDSDKKTCTSEVISP